MLTENSQMTKLNNKMMGYNFWSHSFEVKSEKYGGLDFLKKKKKRVLRQRCKHEECHECCVENKEVI